MLLSLSQRWAQVKIRLLAVRRRSWLIAALLSFAGWFLLGSTIGVNFSAWWLLLDAPLNFGWIFCGCAAAGLLEQAFAKPQYVVSGSRTERPRKALWLRALEGLLTLVCFGFFLLLAVFPKDVTDELRL